MVRVQRKTSPMCPGAAPISKSGRGSNRVGTEKTPWSFQEATGHLKKGTFDDMVDQGFPLMRVIRGKGLGHTKLKDKGKRGE